MAPLTALLLLALGAETKAEAHCLGSMAVFQCMFAPQDEEIYGWPAGWTRRHGPGFPRYVRIRENDDCPPPGGRCLQIELNGGAAAAYSPPISANPDVQYLLEGYVKTSGLQHDGAYFSLIFLDSARTKLSSVTAEKISGTSAWQKVRLGPVLPPAGTASVLVGLHVEPQGETQDLRGTASFGALWLWQLPRIVLTAQPARETLHEQEKSARNWTEGKQPPSRSANDATFLLFSRGRPIEIACMVSGFALPKYKIRLELLDVGGRKIAEHQKSLNQRTHHAPRDEPHHADHDQAYMVPDMVPGDEYVGSPFGQMTWRLPCDVLGFYRVRATIVPVAPSLPSSSPAADSVAETAPRAELSLAIIEPQSLPPGSEFGWSLGPNDAKVGLVPLGDLLSQCGIQWVKFPFATGTAAVEPVDGGLKEKTENPGAGMAVEAASRSVAVQAASPVPKMASKSQAIASNSLESLINFSDRLDMAGVSLAGVLQPPRWPKMPPRHPPICSPQRPSPGIPRPGTH